MWSWFSTCCTGASVDTFRWYRPSRRMPVLMPFQLALVPGCRRYSTVLLWTKREMPNHRRNTARWSTSGQIRIFLHLPTVEPEAGQAAGERMDNGQQVLDEFAFGAAVRVAENHHLAPVGLDEPGNEVKP